MTKLLRWLFSFVASEVTVENNVSREVFCGEKTLLCSIVLTDANAAFTNYHINQIEAVNNERGSVFKKSECKTIIEEERSRLLVYCVAKRAARARIKLDLGKWYSFKGKSDFLVDFRPSCPTKLAATKTYGDMYVGGLVKLRMASFDRFNNKATACEHEIATTCYPPGALTLMSSERRKGEYCIILHCNVKCEAKVCVQVEQNNDCEVVGEFNPYVESVSFGISHPPLSVEHSLCRTALPFGCQPTAGVPFVVEIELNDVFGEPVHPDLIPSISATTSQSQVLKYRVHSTSYRNKKLLEITETRAGIHLVHIVLNNKIIPNWDLKIRVQASCPKYLRSLKVTCHSKDSRFTPKENALYYGAWSNLEADITDEYGNLLVQNAETKNYKVFLEASDDNGAPSKPKWKNAAICNGKIHVKVLPQQVGPQTLVVRLNDQRNPKQEYATMAVEINVVDPPCSAALTRVMFNTAGSCYTCTAGSEHEFNVQIYNVFGNVVRKESKTRCDVTAQVIPRQQGEYVRKQENSQSTALSFTVTVNLMVAGTRIVKLLVNWEETNAMEIPIKVVASTPHHSNQLRFTPEDSKDSHFTADPRVLYNSHWSTLEANMVDKYDNVVTHLDDSWKVRMEAKDNKDKKIIVAYEGATIQDGRLGVKVKLGGNGERHLSIILANNNTPNEEYHIEKITVQVIDAPFSLALSRIQKTGTCVAGTEFKFQVFPFDVFGKPITANSTSECVVGGEILDYQSESNAGKEQITCTTAKNSTSYFINVSVVLMKAGERRLEIFDMKKISKRRLSLHVKPHVSSAHLVHDKQRETYKGKHLNLNARLLDKFENEIAIQSSSVNLQQQSGPKSGLHYTVTAKTDSSVTIEYYFTQKGTHHLCLQCQDDEGHDPQQSSFSIKVEDAPADLQRSMVTWIPKYEDIPDQPVFCDDKNFACRVQLIDVLGKNYEGIVNCSNLTVKYEGTEIPGILTTQSGDDACVEVIVPLKGNFIKEGDFEPTFWFFLDGKRISSPLVLSTFDGFEEFDEERCTIKELGKIACDGVKRKDIIGEDYCNLNNIKRVCELEDDPDILENTEEFEDDDEDDDEDEDERIVTVITLQGLDPKSSNSITKVCHKLLLHLLKALYFRQRASEADLNREDWKEMATANYNRIHNNSENLDDYRPTFCSKIKEKYAKLMKRYNDVACEEIFQFFNTGRSQSEIDLHGLLVGDEKKLKDYERQLLHKGQMRKEEVRRKINEEREHSNEAIRKLKERFQSYDIETAREDQEPWLEIIVGAGHHSKIKDRQNIRPKVEQYLREEKKYDFSPVNKGALVITFEEYKGQEPCFGEYYCKKCDNRWRNRKSWIDKWQACYKCYENRDKLIKCFPLKQRLRRKWLPYRPTAAAPSEYIPHLEELCQKCTELGKLCSYP